MGYTKTYSPKRCVLTVAGIRVEGFSDNDMFTVSLDERSFVKFIGADGDVARSHNPATSGKFVLSLNQTSTANQVLSGLLQADVLENTGRLVFPVTLYDLNSNGTFYLGLNCWIEGVPESGYGKAVGTREWVIESTSMKYNISGYGSNIIMDTLNSIIS